MTIKPNTGARGLQFDKEKDLKNLDNSFTKGLYNYTLSGSDVDSIEDCRVLSKYSSISDLRQSNLFPTEKGLGNVGSLFLILNNDVRAKFKYVHTLAAFNSSSWFINNIHSSLDRILHHLIQLYNCCKNTTPLNKKKYFINKPIETNRNNMLPTKQKWI